MHWAYWGPQRAHSLRCAGPQLSTSIAHILKHAALGMGC